MPSTTDTPPHLLKTTAIGLSNPHMANPKSRNVRIRAAGLSDAAAITRVGRKTFRAMFGWSMPSEHMEEYLSTAYAPEAIAKEIANRPTNTFFVAEGEQVPDSDAPDSIVGFVQMKLGTTEPCIPNDVPVCELHRIYVDADCLGGGVGGMLIARGIEWAVEYVDGLRKASEIEIPKAALWLGVWEENDKALRFYKRSGFERVGHHDFVMGDTTQRDNVLLKWI